MSGMKHRGSLRFVGQKLRERHIWERIARERLAEPLHLNIASLFVAMFGSLRSKIYFDRLPRRYSVPGAQPMAGRTARSG